MSDDLWLDAAEEAELSTEGSPGSPEAEGKSAFDPEKTAALFSAVLEGDTQQMAILSVSGADLNGRDPEGLTPLMAAVRAGKLDGMKALIKLGAALDACDTPTRLTALMWAVKAGQPEALKVLLRAGADPLVTNGTGQTAADFASAIRNIPLMAILRAAEKAGSAAPAESGAPPGTSRAPARPSLRRAAPRPRSQGRRIVLLVGGAFAAIALIGFFIVGFLGLGPMSGLSGAMSSKKTEAEAKYALYMAVAEVEAARAKTGKLPETISGKSLDGGPACSYVVLPGGSQYKISLLRKGHAYTYESTQGVQNAFGEYTNWGGIPSGAARPASTAKQAQAQAPEPQTGGAAKGAKGESKS